MRSSALRLDGMPQALRPAVVVIDSFTENRRLAMVVEPRSGKADSLSALRILLRLWIPGLRPSTCGAASLIIWLARYSNPMCRSASRNWRPRSFNVEILRELCGQVLPAWCKNIVRFFAVFSGWQGSGGLRQ
jgi:hypothetical protein